MPNPTRTCSIDGCERKHEAHGWCSMHYQRWKRHGSLDRAAPYRRPKSTRTCSVEKCERKHASRGWCQLHYTRWREHGTTELPPKVQATCALAECDRVVKAGGYCSLHYERLRRHGTVEPPTKRAMKICTIAECGKPAVGRGWCKTHYYRWKRTGDPTTYTYFAALETIRQATFGTDCVTEWPHGTNGREGRPALNYGGRPRRAVWVAWVLRYGTEPVGQLNHYCDDARCWNPLHVYDGTQQENMRDRAVRGTAWNQKLSDADVREIRRLRADGMLCREIAERFGVRHATISRIVSGDRRRWVS